LDFSEFTFEKTKTRFVTLEMHPESKPGRIIGGGLDTAGMAK
jgi:hypothetical protein